MASKYRNTGQTCVCANRLLVHDAVYDAFAAKLAAAVDEAEAGAGHRRERDAGTADRRQGRRKGGEPHRRCDVEGREGAGRRQAARARRPFLRADDPDRRHAGDGRGARGDVRSGRAVVPLHDGSRGDRAGQRHRVRPRGVLLRPRHRPHLARRRSARVRDRRHQHRASSRPKSRRSAASRSRGSAARDRSTGSRSFSRSSICVWAASKGFQISDFRFQICRIAGAED